MLSSICVPSPGNRRSSSTTKRRKFVASTSISDCPPVYWRPAEPERMTFGKPYPAASIAARTFGGLIGRSGMRMPIAPRTAFDTAAIGGTIGTSPTPFTP